MRIGGTTLVIALALLAPAAAAREPPSLEGHGGRNTPLGYVKALADAYEVCTTSACSTILTAGAFSCAPLGGHVRYLGFEPSGAGVVQGEFDVPMNDCNGDSTPREGDFIESCIYTQAGLYLANAVLVASDTSDVHCA